jgi:hypothetical protein
MVPRMRGVHSGDQPACYFAALGAPQVQIAQREEGHVIYKMAWSLTVELRRLAYSARRDPRAIIPPRRGMVWNRSQWRIKTTSGRVGNSPR